MEPCDLVELIEQRHRPERFAIDSHRITAFEADADVIGLIGSAHWRAREEEEILRRLPGRILERPALVRDMPDVAVTREDLLLRRRDRDPVQGRIVEGVLARADFPFAPR